MRLASKKSEKIYQITPFDPRPFYWHESLVPGWFKLIFSWWKFYFILSRTNSFRNFQSQNIDMFYQPQEFLLKTEIDVYPTENIFWFLKLKIIGRRESVFKLNVASLKEINGNPSRGEIKCNIKTYNNDLFTYV